MIFPRPIEFRSPLISGIDEGGKEVVISNSNNQSLASKYIQSIIVNNMYSQTTTGGGPLKLAD